MPTSRVRAVLSDECCPRHAQIERSTSSVRLSMARSPSTTDCPSAPSPPSRAAVARASASLTSANRRRTAWSITSGSGATSNAATTTRSGRPEAACSRQPELSPSSIFDAPPVPSGPSADSWLLNRPFRLRFTLPYGVVNRFRPEHRGVELFRRISRVFFPELAAPNRRSRPPQADGFGTGC